MAKPFDIPVWKKAPFIRLLIPLTAGIILQWYLQLPLLACLFGLGCFFTAYLLFFLFPLAVRYKLQWLQAIILNLLLIVIGALLTWQKDIRHNKNWFGNYYYEKDYLVVRIDEPLIEKAKSYKAEGCVESVIHNDSVINSRGKILLYFSKNSVQPTLQYGDRILVNKNLQVIKNSGNPGAFDYQRHAAFQSIFHNVFLKENNWVLLPGNNINHFKQFIFTSRENILTILQKSIPAGKDELGIAEALLIGYTDDLDKDLVQAYSNAGVVHIIAISGMHLGLIYIMLVWIFSKLPVVSKLKTTQVVLILSCLWMFAILTGGSASVLRSAVMFTFITLGKNLSKRASIYNSLAASAFVMLCYNPYFLWDVGFQLSYFAVIGIIVFQKPIYNWFYIKNKPVNEIWKLMAVALAAQVLTFPICIYYFHQFPNLFLITNIIAVPLSSIILFVEIGLVAFSWFSTVAVYLGKIIGWMIWGMNWIILRVNGLSFAVWDGLSATVVSTWLLYTFVLGIASWLLNKNKNALLLAMSCLSVFTMLKAFSNWQIKNQQKIIVYNVPQHQAIDFIHGNNYQFLGDSILLSDGVLQNFHLKPSRISFQLNNRVDMMPSLFRQELFYQLGNKKIVVIDSSFQFEAPTKKINVDIIIISKNPKLRMVNLAHTFNCGQYVFDASNSLWKINQWQKECKELHLNFHSVPADGAFVFTVDI